MTAGNCHRVTRSTGNATKFMAMIEDRSLSLDNDSSQSGFGNAAVNKDETNASNNSSAQKKGEKSASKSGKSNKKSPSQVSSQSQNSRRNGHLEKLRRDGYVYESHTQTFLNFLSRTNPESRNVKSKVFKNQLMMAESMDEIPTSFAKNWLMIVTPVGSRCLVVASMGHTGAYSKTGYHIISHPSSLPMGNKAMQGYGACVLDCIYCNETETYFVLDIMFWDGQPLYDCESQMRFRQLQERIREYDLGRPSRQNPYPFVPLKTFTPTKSNICSAVKLAPYMIDGLLFYHKEATYTPGTTPLVLWLTLDRLPTKMKIEIPEMGIVTAVSYKDPVALALAHGVSPAIISQVYPTGAGMRGRARNGRGQGRESQGPGRCYQELSGMPGSQNYSQGSQNYSQGSQNYSQGSQNYSQGSQRFYSGQQTRRGQGSRYQSDDYGYLSDMMMNLNVGHGGQGPYGQMMNAGGAFYGNYNMNNSASSFYGRRDAGQRRFQQQSPQTKSKAEKKKKKAQAPRSDDYKQSNWDEPHSAMKSQWMTKIPEDFESEYLTCITPLGKRRIIVAARGRTCTYNKYGRLVDTFTSSLPSGAPDITGANELVVLDSFWCGSLQKYYVFDVMYWRLQPFYDAEAEFRFFWVSDKVEDVTLVRSKKEAFAVEVLPVVSSDRESITAALKKAEFRIDGLLCYQKNSKYSSSASKEALWLKLDMMEEALGYPPPDEINFKPSTEKERKQRLHFMNVNAEAETPQIAETSNTEQDEEITESELQAKFEELGV